MKALNPKDPLIILTDLEPPSSAALMVLHSKKFMPTHILIVDHSDMDDWPREKILDDLYEELEGLKLDSSRRTCSSDMNVLCAALVEQIQNFPSTTINLVCLSEFTPLVYLVRKNPQLAQKVNVWALGFTIVCQSLEHQTPKISKKKFNFLDSYAPHVPHLESAYAQGSTGPQDYYQHRINRDELLKIINESFHQFVLFEALDAFGQTNIATVETAPNFSSWICGDNPKAVFLRDQIRRWNEQVFLDKFIKVAHEPCMQTLCTSITFTQFAVLVFDQTSKSPELVNNLRIALDQIPKTSVKLRPAVQILKHILDDPLQIDFSAVGLIAAVIHNVYGDCFRRCQIDLSEPERRMIAKPSMMGSTYYFVSPSENHLKTLTTLSAYVASELNNYLSNKNIS